MIFLANESFPEKSVESLRASGYQVVSIKEEMPGISDFTVLQKAKELGAVILTFDKDYGEIIFRIGFEYPPSVVFFRFKGITGIYAGETLLSIIQSEQFHLEGYFTVVEENNIRQRKL